ncbi:MAG: hypothetical protein VX519_00625 [Myxococcota bacterium]|nr:hypothetical protein [Myxococcota bacterium]
MTPSRKKALTAILIAWVPVSLEIWVRHLELDRQWIASTLYYQESDLAVQQTSEDPILHYELAPGSTLEARSRWGGTYLATIGPQGARGNAHDLQPSQEVFRVLFFGASTVYGVEVSDHETLPSRLEYHLQESAPDGAQIEVWNFGTPAYVPAQMARLAHQKIQSIPEVDLVVMMPTNRGRRAFLGGPDRLAKNYQFFFENDPILWPENFPGPGFMPATAHLWGLNHLASYRWAWISLSHERLRHASTNESTQALSAREMSALEARAATRDIPIVHAGYPPLSDTTELPAALQDLSPEKQKAGLEDRHPSPEILDLHARSLAADLIHQQLMAPVIQPTVQPRSP